MQEHTDESREEQELKQELRELQREQQAMRARLKMQVAFLEWGMILYGPDRAWRN